MTKAVIIGAGVIGCAVARELSRYNFDITVLEKENDVSCGTSKANSGIVHAGFDAKLGSLKSMFNIWGNKLFDDLSANLDFPFKRNGAYVLAFDKDDIKHLEVLLTQGREGGVEGLEIVDGDSVRAKLPEVSKEVVAALWAPTSGIVSPYEMTVALAENSFANGVKYVFETKVDAIVREGEKWRVCCGESSYAADAVINCAGVYADDINAMACGRTFDIVPRKGEYVLMDKTCGYLTSATLFQTPTAMGKGILVTPTTHGNIIVGPTAEDIEDKDSVITTAQGLKQAFEKGRRSVPSLNKRNIITQFTGLRAHNEGDDFIIREECDGFFNVAAIESPGLSSAPAIALYTAGKVAEKFGAGLNNNFVEKRKGTPVFASMTDEERQDLIEKNPLYGRVVCRCETVTEGEIVDCITRPLGAKDTDGVKRRTRAGMGRCQGGFCSERVMEILARELGISILDVTKAGKGSQILVGRTK